MACFAVILPAAGQSTRFGGREKKQFTSLDGRPVWLRTAELFVNRGDVVQVILVIHPEDQDLFRTRFGPNIAFLNIQTVPGGRERFESVANALLKLNDQVEYVAIHDVVRPCLTPSLIDTVFTRATQTGAAMLGIPVSDTLKRANSSGEIEQTVARDGYWLAQTPQVFRRNLLQEAYSKRHEIKIPITDDAQLMEASGHKVHLVTGSTTNLKITTREDLLLAEAILKGKPRAKTGPAFFGEEAQW